MKRIRHIIFILALVVAAGGGGFAFAAPALPKPLLTINVPEQLSSLAFSPDNMTLAGGSKGKLYIWNPKGELLHTLDARDAQEEKKPDPFGTGPTFDFWVKDVVFSPDNQHIAANIPDSGIKIWDVKSGKLLHSLYGHQRGTNAMAFSPDGNTLATGGNDKKICLWNVKSGELTKTLEGHTYNPLSVAYSPDGQILTSLAGETAAGNKSELTKWDLKTGLATVTTTLDGCSPVYAVLSQEGRIAASQKVSSLQSNILLWDTETSAFVRKLSVAYSRQQNNVKISPNNEWAVATQADACVVHFYSIKTGHRIYKIGISSATVGPYALSSNNVIAMEVRKKVQNSVYSVIEIRPIIPGEPLYS